MDLVEISKYIFAAVITIYVLVSFTGATIRDDKKRRAIYATQSTTTFIFHLLGYIILFLNNNNDIKYLILYCFEFGLAFATMVVYDVIYPKSSKLLVNNMIFLMSMGYVFIARLNFDQAVRQFIFACIGIGITFFVPMIIKKFKKMRDLGWIYAAVSFTLLLALFFSSRVYGAKINITLGPITIQPSEFVKILFVFFIASMYNKALTWKKLLLTSIAAAAHIVIFIASNDLGAALIFFVAYIMMTFVATRRLVLLLGTTGLGVLGALIAAKTVPHVIKRVVAWRDPWSNIYGSGYQIAYALFSIAAGGWFGVGLTRGRPDTIPFVANDMIFAAISEEMGIIVAIGVLFVSLNCLILIMNIASRCNTLFYRLVAVGFGVTYAFQVFLTVGGVLKIIPLTGVTLPFVSYGGSSLVVSLIMFAIINGMYTMRQDSGESSKPDITYRRREPKVKVSNKNETGLNEDMSEYFKKDDFESDISKEKKGLSSEKSVNDRGKTKYYSPEDFKNIDDYNEFDDSKF
ncbi:MAG: FtsW/RodA/SpoVE family cell cycle protein [Lachnospiraceae bacterium]|nr:FtsW/RodA/SpoVE family cell cycle protein [Lachnospiraceae bacterium]